MYITIPGSFREILQRLHSGDLLDNNLEFLCFWLLDENNTVYDMYIPYQKVSATLCEEVPPPNEDGKWLVKQSIAFNQAHRVCRHHSHNNMVTSPSGTDMETLKEDKRISFISNNKGDLQVYWDKDEPITTVNIRWADEANLQHPLFEEALLKLDKLIVRN